MGSSLILYKTGVIEGQSAILNNWWEDGPPSFPLRASHPSPSFGELADLPMWDCTEADRMKTKWHLPLQAHVPPSCHTWNSLET